MLVDTQQLVPDAIARVMRYGLFAGVVAECEQSGARLRVGAGRRRAGRPRRYYISAPVELLPAGRHYQTSIGTLTAHSDALAIAAANRRLRKLLDAHLRATFPEQYAGGI